MIIVQAPRTFARPYIRLIGTFSTRYILRKRGDFISPLGPVRWREELNSFVPFFLLGDCCESFETLLLLDDCFGVNCREIFCSRVGSGVQIINSGDTMSRIGCGAGDIGAGFFRVGDDGPAELFSRGDGTTGETIRVGDSAMGGFPLIGDTNDGADTDGRNCR
jgi:hypothetical protein